MSFNQIFLFFIFCPLLKILYNSSDACGIEVGSRFIVTGGADRRKDGPMRALNTVAKYNKFGLEEYLPALNQNRSSHACASFISDSGQTVKGFIFKYKLSTHHHFSSLSRFCLWQGGLPGQENTLVSTQQKSWSPQGNPGGLSLITFLLREADWGLGLSTTLSSYLVRGWELSQCFIILCVSSYCYIYKEGLPNSSNWGISSPSTRQRNPGS